MKFVLNRGSRIDRFSRKRRYRMPIYDWYEKVEKVWNDLPSGSRFIWQGQEWMKIQQHGYHDPIATRLSDGEVWYHWSCFTDADSRQCPFKVD
jgi:hypothetical protein